MSLWSDDRAAAIQVGAIVLFAFVILAITAYQASVVPGQNKDIEYNHNQRLQSQLQDVEGAIGSMPATQDDRTVTVDLSTSYPARTIFINPPPPTGRLETLGTRNDTIAFEVQNATATNPDVADFWNGTTRNYSTGALAYSPNYNVYNQAPVTVVENSLVYNEFANARLRANAQSLFDGDSISLVALRGSLSENGGTASVNVRPVSASTTTVPVRASGTDNVTISIVSRLSPREWNETLADAGELANQSGYVANVSGDVIGSLDGNDLYRVNFTMVRGQTYDLQLARVGVGELDTDERTTNASYAIAVTETVTTEEDTNATVTVAVRDQYGNPKSGVSVNATVDGSTGTIADSPQTTDEDGRATFTYNTTDDVSGSSSKTDTVQVSFSGDPATGTFDESAPENVTAEVTVKNTDGSGTGTGGGGGGAYGIEFDDGESYDWNVSKEGSSITLVASTVPEPLDGVSTDFAVNDSSIATIANEDGQTNSTGDADVELNAQANGTVAVYVGSSGSSDVINVTVRNVGGGGGGTNSPPTADFTVTPSSPLVNESTEFDATGSSDSDGTIKSYQWDFGDGTTTNGVSPNHTYASSGTYTVTLTVEDDDGATDTKTIDVTVRSLPKMSAVEPDPDALADSDGEFVRVYFPTSTDTTGWTIIDDEDDTTSLPSTTLSGEVYFVKNETAFVDQWGVDPSRVYGVFSTDLRNTGDVIELRTDRGRLIDEFGYNGVTTSNGWTLTGVDTGEVAVRKTDGSGNYLDTNESDDWLTEDENSFFGADTSSPVVSSASVENAPINYSDASGTTTQTVTVTFNESMNTSVDPTVQITSLPNSADLTVSGSWVDATTWTGEVDFPQKDDDTTAVIEVAGAEDDSGNVQDPDPDTSNTFEVDTNRPGDPDTARIVTDPIVSSNENNVTVEVDLATTSPEPGTVYVELTGPNGNTVTGSADVNTSGQTTTVTGIDASPLADGGNAISASARVVDAYGNENPSGFMDLGSNATKDTTAPGYVTSGDVGLEVTANPKNTGVGNNQITSVTFDYYAKDNVVIQQMTFEVIKDGTVTDTFTRQPGNKTTQNQFTGDLASDQSAPVDVRVTITDGAGNSYTCTGTLQNKDSTITLADMSCSPSLASLQPIDATLGRTTATQPSLDFDDSRTLHRHAQIAAVLNGGYDKRGYRRGRDLDG